MQIDSIILDWSGTMVDDLEPVLLTTNHVRAQYGRAPLSREEFRREFFLPVARCYARWIPEASLAELEALFHARYPAYRDTIHLLDHTAAFLGFCRARRLPVFVASSADTVTYDMTMRRFGLADEVTRAYLGIADKTETIHLILADNGLVPRQTLFVGDMEHDLEAGRAGGVLTCAVLSGYTHPEVLAAREPDFICAHLGEVQERLLGNLAPPTRPVASVPVQ
ncbi:HAD family hydrolase [bacterium]|nr:HAD family hydrolase [bacterium]